MQTLSQKPNYGACVLSTRIKNDTYKSINDIISASGYRDTASFLRDAVTTKCREELREIERRLESLTN